MAQFVSDSKCVLVEIYDSNDNFVTEMLMFDYEGTASVGDNVELALGRYGVITKIITPEKCHA